MPLFPVIMSFLKGEIVIKWWLGTDALTMWYFPPGKNKMLVILHRIKMWVISPFVEHWATGKILLSDISTIVSDNCKIVYWPGKYQEKLKKKEHKGFNILYYHPTEPGSVTKLYPVKNKISFVAWKYGLDIIEELKRKIPNVTWVPVDGTLDMENVYPCIDLMVRPSRHDGAPRINVECELNDIPVIYPLGNKTDSVLKKPDIDRIEQEISGWLEIIR